MNNNLIKLLMLILVLIATGCAKDTYKEKGLVLLSSDDDKDIYLSKVNHRYNGNIVLSSFDYVIRHKEPEVIEGKEIRSSKTVILLDCSTKYKVASFPPVLYSTDDATGEPVYDLKMPGQWQVFDDGNSGVVRLWNIACTEKYEIIYGEKAKDNN